MANDFGAIEAEGYHQWQERNSEEEMGWMTGFEPATSGSTIRRSNQLSYTHHEERLKNGDLNKGESAAATNGSWER